MYDALITSEVLDILYTGKKIVMFTIDEVKKGEYPFSEIEQDLKYMNNLMEHSRKNKKVDIEFVEAEYKEIMKEIWEAIERELNKKL